MHKHNVKRGVIVVVVFLIFINYCYFAQAFGVSTPYLENDTLKMEAGQTSVYTITVQNGDNQDYYVNISYSSTDNIANLRKTAYFIPSKTYNNTFYFDISVPKNASKGQSYTLEYSAKPITNESSTLSVGLEIKRHITIEVIDENNITTISQMSSNQKQVAEKEIKETNIWKIIKNCLLAAIILTLVILIINRIWKVSKGISSKLSTERITNYTISQAMNLKEVRTLLEKMSDDEFRLAEIRKLFKEKIFELTTHNITKDINNMSRKDLIRIVDTLK